MNTGGLTGAGTNRTGRPAADAKRAVSPRSPGEARDSLAQYLGDMQAYSVLGAEQEVSLAQSIERLEIAHFRALLAYAPALDTVIAALKPHMEVPKEVLALRTLARSLPNSQAEPTGPSVAEWEAEWERATQAAAEKLRECDTEHLALSAVDARVREVFGKRRGSKRYLQHLRQARAAQQEVKNRFMTANLRLVVLLARRYDRGLMALSDLIQEGNLGLMRAVERFDYRRGYRFSTYASWWIRHFLNRALSDKARLVRVPVHLLDDAQRVARASAELQSLSHEKPSQAQLAEKTGLGEEKLAFVQQHTSARHHVSLDRRLGDDNDASLLDVIPSPITVAPEEAIDAAQWSGHLDKLLSTLTPIEADILRFRFGLDDDEELTLREIGLKYNLSRERIRQLQEQALNKLRAQLTRTTGSHAAA